MGNSQGRKRPVSFLTRIKGGRLPLSAAVEHRLKQAVRRAAARYGVSMSFVVNTAVADALGVPLRDEYK